MKFLVQGSHPDNTFTVEFSMALISRLPSLYEKFEVSAAKDGVNFETRVACFLADGKSLLLGNDIIRFSKQVLVKRGDKYQLGLQSQGDALRQRSLLVKPVRAVEPKRNAASLGGGDLKSPMTGKILTVAVEEGAQVKEGETLVVIEAMKMENRILAECAGLVKNIKAVAGKSISIGEVLLTLEPQLEGVKS